MKKINTYIIPVLNNYKGLVRLLETLELHTPQNYDIIVIHNGSYLVNTSKSNDIHLYKDEPLNRFLDYLKAKVTLWIDPYRNLGFGKAMNLGIKMAQTKFVTIANDDVEIMYDSWWDEVMALFEADPQLGGFNPHSPCNKAADGNRYVEYPYKKKYNADDIAKIKEFFKGQRYYQGCCTYFTICKKKMFDEVGLFDESFWNSGEDYDLCIRASRTGWKICGGSEVIVFHWWGFSSADEEEKLTAKKNATRNI